MPSDVQVPRQQAALVRAFNLKGRFGLKLDEVIVPVAIVEDVRASDIKGTGFSGSQFRAAVALERAVIRWSVAAGGNFNALPKWLVIRPSGATDQAELRVNTTGLSSVLTGALVMPGTAKWSMTGLAPVTPETGTFAGAITGTIRRRIQCPADVDTFVDLSGWRIQPGQELSIEMVTANVAVNFSANWDVESRDT